jgi:hypothetical protein
MTREEPQLAVLEDDEVQELRTLEDELGENVVILAYEKPLELANLNEDQLAKLWEMEQKLGHACLVAYRKPK